MIGSIVLPPDDTQQAISVMRNITGSLQQGAGTGVFYEKQTFCVLPALVLTAGILLSG